MDSSGNQRVIVERSGQTLVVEKGDNVQLRCDAYDTNKVNYIKAVSGFKESQSYGYDSGITQWVEHYGIAEQLSG